MATKDKIPVLILAFVLVCGCGKENPSQPTKPGPLEGTWSESYLWESMLNDYRSTEKTSTLMLGGKAFTLKILPPHRVLVVEGDSIYTAWSADTLYTGSYGTKSDTLSFYVDQLDGPWLFRFSCENESLSLEQLPVGYSGDIAIVRMNSFLWGHSFLKTSGTFMRVD